MTLNHQRDILRLLFILFTVFLLLFTVFFLLFVVFLLLFVVFLLLYQPLILIPSVLQFILILFLKFLLHLFLGAHR
jgi:hypothetical protein